MSLPAIYTDDNAAREHLEKLLWPEGPICPHCGNSHPDRITKLAGKSTRPGVYKCKECRKPFSVTVGTVFERSHIPLAQWVYAVHLYTASKKGFSAHQLHRTLNVQYRTAWFMAHRIREAMRDVNPSALGGSGKIVEADETYFGKLETPRVSKQRGTRPYIRRKKSGMGTKRAVCGLVERGGNVRTFHIDNATKADIARVVRTNVSRDSALHTDESKLYTSLGAEFAAHETVTHSVGEYVRDHVHTNTIEGVFSIFKRGMKGIYQHCGEAHLHRYLAEFDFRYNHRIKLGFNDTDRAEQALKGISGKRLTYRRPDETAHA